MLSSALHAKHYEWVDEKGQRHFSDRKPIHDVDYESHDQIQSDLFSDYDSEIKVKRSKPVSKNRSSGKKRKGRRKKDQQVKKQQERCQSYLNRMDKVQEKLRRGYQEPQGNKLRQKRRALSVRYQKECT